MPSPFSKESEIFTDVTTVVCGLFTPPSAFTEEEEEKEEDDDADVEDEDVEENVDVKVEEEVEEEEVEEDDDVKSVLPSLP
jgi:hypothetical protein